MGRSPYANLIREDEKGLYVIAGGYAARPGVVSDYNPYYTDYDTGGLAKKDLVAATHIVGTTFTQIRTKGGLKLLWIHDPSYDPVDGWPDGRRK